MFREPEDCDVQRAGWPWHGLVEDGVLTLPSERRLPIKQSTYSDSNCTSLWDIGFPDLGVDQSDPDALWLGKAIIRGLSTASRKFYGGAVNSHPPVYVDGVVRRCSDFLFNDVHLYGIFQSVSAEIELEGRRISSNDLTLSDFGYAGEGGGVFVEILDARWDRARWLGRVSLYSQTMAIVQAYLTPDLELVLEVLADYAECIVGVVSDDEPINVPPSGRLDGNPNGTPLAGEYVATRTFSCVISALYDLSGSPELVRLNVDAKSTYMNSGPDIDPGDLFVEEKTNEGEIWLSSSLGSTSRLHVKKLRKMQAGANVGSSGWRLELKDYIGGVETFSHVNTVGPWPWGAFDRGDVPAWVNSSDLSWGISWFVSEYSSDVRTLVLGNLETSNALKQCYARTWNEASVGMACQIACSSALTPSGVDPGEIAGTWARAGDVGRFLTGTFNPITQAVIRNIADNVLRTWV